MLQHHLFNADFYGQYFTSLDEFIESGVQEPNIFLSVLQSCEAQIGHQQSYGEVKAFVLSQTLKLLYDEEACTGCRKELQQTNNRV